MVVQSTLSRNGMFYMTNINDDKNIKDKLTLPDVLVSTPVYLAMLESDPTGWKN
jgi:hypothetical protein